MSTQLVLAEREPALALERDASCRLERAVRQSYQFIWRCLRRWGIRPDAAVDDAAQRVFEVAAKKRHRIEPGHERAFFFKTALLVAAETRREARKRRETPDEVALLAELDPAPGPDEAAEQCRYRLMLDLALDRLPMDLRAVFVLYELEGMPSAEAADLLEIPRGTVASRLKRARSRFCKEVRRLGALPRTNGGGR
ncbi:MAG: sigma-70 family RNA polymerase sigma factor [Polyangiaceae bacterium]|nr:sigma-70 family RNA polymerase sigma factor [Polyangiaceae bacterium]